MPPKCIGNYSRYTALPKPFFYVDGLILQLVLKGLAILASRYHYHKKSFYTCINVLTYTKGWLVTLIATVDNIADILTLNLD